MPEVEDEREDEEEVVKEETEVADEEHPKLKAKELRDRKVRSTPSTRPLDTLTSLHSSPAGATGPMGKVLTIVKIRGHALGKMSGCQNLTCNETGTNSAAKVTFNSFMNYCMDKNRKYMKFI